MCIVFFCTSVFSDYSKTFEERTLWHCGLCPLFGGCPLLEGCPFLLLNPLQYVFWLFCGTLCYRMLELLCCVDLYKQVLQISSAQYCMFEESLGKVFIECSL